MAAPAHALIDDILDNYEQKSLPELQSYISKVDTEIHNVVTHSHPDLLAQTTNVELLDDVVVKTLARTKTCQSSVAKISSNLDNQYKTLEFHVEKLDHMYEGRRCVSLFQEVLKYDELIEGETNLSDVAKYLTQIARLCEEAKLDKLKPFQDKSKSLSLNIEKQTENMLLQGLNEKSYTQVASSLQIFINLDTLSRKIEKIFTDVEKVMDHDIKASLNLKLADYNPATGKGQPGRALNSKGNNSSKKQIWTNMETLTTKLVAQTSKIKFLYHVMKSGKDLNSNLYYEAFLNEDVWTKFWNKLMESLAQYFSSIPKSSDFIKALLEDEYPKLLRIITSLGSQIDNCSDLKISVGISSGVRATIVSFEKAFLSKSLAKLFDRVNHIFAKAKPYDSATCPSNADIDSLLSTINSEVNVEDAHLKKLMARNVTKTCQLFCVKIEQLVCNDGSATQVIGPATDSQVLNARLTNTLDHFRSKLSPENSEPILILMGNILSPLVQAIGESIEAIILTIHQENFKRTSRVSEYSLYMGELSSFLSRVGKDYFSLYKSNEIIQKCSLKLSTLTISSLIINITILQNLGREAQKQLLIDLNHLEIALTPVCQVPQDLRFLRAFRNILQMNVEEFKNSNLIGSYVPHSYAVLLLISKTNGKIPGPNTVKNWSTPRYVRWLVEHSEKEKMSLLTQCLETYVQSVTSTGQTEFHPYYPIVKDLIQSSFSE